MSTSLNPEMSKHFYPKQTSMRHVLDELRKVKKDVCKVTKAKPQIRT